MATIPAEEYYKLHHLDVLLNFYQESALRALQQDRTSCNMSHSNSTRSASMSACDTMICVECFRSKGDSELTIPCQNPRCHFYLQLPRDKHQRYPSESYTERPSTSDSTFSKEVGHNRQQKPKLLPNQSFHHSSSKPSSSGIWAYQPDNPFHVPQYTNRQQKDAVQRFRSQSISTHVGGNSEKSKVMATRGSNQYTHYHRLGESSRSRLMSMPMTMESLPDQGGDLVEDAFLPSPGLPPEGIPEDMKHRLGTPDTDKDSGVSSPFGCTSFMDWIDPSSTSFIAPAGPASSMISPGCLSVDMSFLKVKDTMSDLQVPNADSDRGSSNERSPSPGESRKRLSTVASETYSRKVFIGGLPPDIDEDEIRTYFLRYGSVTVDWPHKNQNKGCIPPKGYAFLLFKDEPSVHKLLHSCFSEDDKYFIYIPTSALARKKVQIRPWYISDSHYTVGGKSVDLDSRKSVFVGGVPRPLKAVELAEVMTEKYGNVAYVAIDCDSDLKYPKGAACVMFSSSSSYIAAVSARFMQLNYGSLDKKVEIKPYVLDGQECDECHGVQCDGKPAPFFCGTVTCLQYYCEYCWATVHSIPGRQNHRPLLKDIGDKARYY